MPNVGPLEIAIVLIIVLIIFGPKRLPELGRSMGRGIREFRSSIGGDKDKDSPAEERRELESSEPTAPSAPSEPSARSEPNPSSESADSSQSSESNPSNESAEAVQGEVVGENKA